MTVKRRFLLASSLARLIRKERGSRPVIEAHFAPSEGRHAHVLFDNGTCELILLTNGPDGEPEEERTEVPARQGKFLVDVSAGTIGYNRVRFELGRRELSINCFTAPIPVAIAELEFEGQKDADSFTPPAWFGLEVTSDTAYEHQSIAINGLEAPPDVSISNASLHSLIDLFDRRASHRLERDLDTPEQLVAERPRPVSPNGEDVAVSEAAGSGG